MTNSRLPVHAVRSFAGQTADGTEAILRHRPIAGSNAAAPRRSRWRGKVPLPPSSNSSRPSQTTLAPNGGAPIGERANTRQRSCAKAAAPVEPPPAGPPGRSRAVAAAEPPPPPESPTARPPTIATTTKETEPASHRLRRRRRASSNSMSGSSRSGSASAGGGGTSCVTITSQPRSSQSARSCDIRLDVRSQRGRAPGSRARSSPSFP